MIVVPYIPIYIILVVLLSTQYMHDPVLPLLVLTLQLQIFLYQVKSAVRRFHDVSSLTLQELANQILSDEIHILVDLMGFSTGGRPALFALKPAPIQVAYMGYPGKLKYTAGSSCVH